MIQKFHFASLVFFGAALALLFAKRLFAATGLAIPETIAMGGFLMSFGAYLFLRLRQGGQAHG